MIDNFISEFSITNSWNAEKWSRLMEDVKNMTCLLYTSDAADE